ncbi:PEGA domain-containing protein [Draconibacterium sediminis]|uniref:PEGA domain-containing protein n=1 Tax=Draconibacterium sediminis TaxID=1544798 RepID=UPI0026EFC08C|nr:PEGA domain-containing protein [Draconibacterium sediminis]
MKKSILALSIVAALLFSSCATIISGSRQNVTIASTPSAADVYINGVDMGKTPVTKNLKRNQEYTVLIELEGYLPYETLLTKEFNAWYLGNILIGGLIGLIIDPITGAIYKLSPQDLHARLDGETVLQNDGKDMYMAVSLDIDPSWEKIAQLEKAE